MGDDYQIVKVTEWLMKEDIIIRLQGRTDARGLIYLQLEVTSQHPLRTFQ